LNFGQFNYKNNPPSNGIIIIPTGEFDCKNNQEQSRSILPQITIIPKAQKVGDPINNGVLSLTTNEMIIPKA
jgi:hypothetical protein